MTNNPPNPPIPPATAPFIDNPHAHDIFVDAVSGVFTVSGNVRLTLESWRVNHSTSPGPVSRVVIGRVVMPFEQAELLRDLLIDHLAKMKARAGMQQVQGPVTIQ